MTDTSKKPVALNDDELDTLAGGVQMGAAPKASNTVYKKTNKKETSTLLYKGDKQTAISLGTNSTSSEISVANDTFKV